MAIRRIVTIKDDEAFLRKISRPVEVFDARLKELVDDMYETLIDEQGYGLAAPQIGILKRLAVIIYEDKRYELINPEIIEREGEQTDYEGCLSVRGRNRLVVRPKKITVLTHDLAGKRRKITASRMLARIFCHEMDHLDGILYTDKCLPEEAEKNFNPE